MTIKSLALQHFEHARVLRKILLQCPRDKLYRMEKVHEELINFEMKLIAAADLWAPWEQKLVERLSRGRLRSLPNEAIIVAARSQRSNAQNAVRSLGILAKMTQEDSTLHKQQRWNGKLRLSSLITKFIKQLISSRLNYFTFCFNISFSIQALHFFQFSRHFIHITPDFASKVA